MPEGVLEVGSRLGKYEIVCHIATGGMGAVYKATDLELRRTVALKVLSTDLAKNDLARERFRREARHAARLSHPHIVTIYECGHDGVRDLHYLALEFVAGIDLGRYLSKHGRLKPVEARRILIQAVRALDHAHNQGIVHRDIKPSNILLARVGTKTVVKLADLGLARAADDDEFRVTREGNTVGTIDYMSPEQARDSAATDIRSDIYSLGCTAYHMLAGKAPFAQGGLGERLFQHLESPPPEVRQANPAVSFAFSGIVRKMLAKKPDDRYATPRDLLRALKHVQADQNDVGEEDKDESTLHDGDEATPTVMTAAKPAPEPAAPTAVTPFVTLDQARTAAAYHDRAVQVLAEGGGDDYARQLLNNALKLDPSNTSYRKSLRDMNRRNTKGTLGRWLNSLNVLTIRSKMRLANSNKDWRKVIELGEDLLVHTPAEVDVHLEMAEAASKLDVTPLAVWLLEQGLADVPGNMPLMRALARMHQVNRDSKQAIVVLQQILSAEPGDHESRRMLDGLLVADHLSTMNRR
ncbi:MAG TPA: protein kinase [Gemmataceae bacterium]|nr:protein kinase [Gemmataceae bacterium]